MKEKVFAKLMELRKEGADDPALLFAAERSVCMAMAYCRLEELPVEMESVCTAMALEIYDEGQSIHSIREGNVTVSFEERKAEHILMQYKEELERFRKAGW